MYLVARARGAEATIGAGDHPLAPNDFGKTDEALGDQLRVLDQMDTMGDHTGDQNLVVG